MAGALGPALARRPLHLFLLLDVSGSMEADQKMAGLNRAVREAIPYLREAEADNPGVELLVRAVTFGSSAHWHLAEPTPIGELEWRDVSVEHRGWTEVGLAVDAVLEQIRLLAAARRGLPPALVLVSDGRPTDYKAPSFGAALRALEADPWGRKASRIAIGIGEDADLDELRRFIGHSELEPVRASNPGELIAYLRWASTVAVDHATDGGEDPDSVASGAAALDTGSTVVNSGVAPATPPAGPLPGSGPPAGAPPAAAPPPGPPPGAAPPPGPPPAAAPAAGPPPAPPPDHEAETRTTAEAADDYTW